LEDGGSHIASGRPGGAGKEGALNRPFVFHTQMQRGYLCIMPGH
jgi:hypothetical protein